jgi:hypothetical protein
MFETVFGSLATAKSSAGAWTFKRVGFFKPRVTVRIQGEENNLVVYYPERAGAEGVLEFSDGERPMSGPSPKWLAPDASALDAPDGRGDPAPSARLNRCWTLMIVLLCWSVYTRISVDTRMVFCTFCAGRPAIGYSMCIYTAYRFYLAEMHG